MALPQSLILIVFIFAISFSSLGLFLKRRRRLKLNLKQKQQQEEEEELAESAATWLLPAADPTATPAANEEREEDSPASGSGGVGGEEKKRKKKAKKKQRTESAVEGSFPCPCPEGDHAAAAAALGGKAVNLFPFSSFASATQRKIKAQYDVLLKSNMAKQLTMAQVGQFANCLVEARNELQHKSEIIQRSFKIKKALLVKADRSSFERLCQQTYKLEAEHKRLEEDAAVYNLLQEQLKLSPAYKTMLEAGAKMELKGSQDRDMDVDFCDISFEELLAQEKKDSFWQRNGKLRSFPS